MIASFIFKIYQCVIVKRNFLPFILLQIINFHVNILKLVHGYAQSLKHMSELNSSDVIEQFL